MALQPTPQSIKLSYDGLFKIQYVHNPFALRPVSYTGLASYLECPGCAQEQRHKRRPKEPKQFTPIRQPTLFGKGEPDARLVGTLLHTLVNFLHDPAGPLSERQREALLADRAALVRFLRQDLLTALQRAGRFKLAQFFDALRLDEEMLTTNLIAPMLLYQRNLASTRAVVFTAAERFQFKLLSTRNTFTNHPDWGGYVTLVGEFDQIRLHGVGSKDLPGGVPAIIEFKKGLGRTRRESVLTSMAGTTHMGENKKPPRPLDLAQPTIAHAMQLMVYWMAFQTRWDIFDKFKSAKGMLEDIQMSLYQALDLILYNLNDGCQYRLLITDLREALQALTNCIFYLDWVMKSGYAWQSPEHDCRKTQLVELPTLTIPVGSTSITAQECYALAREAFDKFKATIRWEIFSL